MSEKPNFFFDQFVPGFDFLKNLANGAGAGAGAGAGGAASSAAKAGMPGIPGVPGIPGMPGIPGISSWVAPTLSVEEVDKRIQELKAVQFWLDQNLHALKATIQALEVQRMTLSTLQGMNLKMGDLAKAFSGGGAAPTEPAQEKAKSRQEAPSPKEGASGAVTPEAKPAAGAVDPMQLWGALTQQFQQIAATALQDAAQLKMPSVLAAKATAKAPPAAAKKQAAGTAAKKAPARKRAASGTARRRSVL